MQIFNTFSGKKETFQPLHGKKAGMYVCGPTVYDVPHLGHGRSAVCFDVMRKYLIYRGYDVTFVTNYTDIDDKLIQRAELMKISVAELAERIIPEYMKDYGALGIMPGDVQPKAAEHVGQMITLIGALEKKGCTYVLDDGVYFDVSTFKNYGKLSKQKLEELKSGIRVTLKESKRHPQDFVLWKFSKPGEPKWPSPWGEGRPGWHIECSAMSKEYLGDTFDIHGGGADLIFPHHECEIAQSEMANGKPFARYWLHNGFIRIDDEKMSKSLGNFFTLRDIFKKYPAQAVRLLFLQTHYRSPIDFTDDLLLQAKNSLMRVHDFMRRLRDYVSPVKNVVEKNVVEFLEKTELKFEAGMDDDFDTSQALGAAFDLIKEMNKRMDQQTLTRDSKEKIMTFLMKLDSVLGIFVMSGTEMANVDEAQILELIEHRNKARKTKNWKAADEIRQKLLKMNIQLEDTAEGTIWKKV